MPDSHAMEIPTSPRGAALVSVDGRAYPLQAARIVAEASGGVAFSTLVQEYENPYDEPLEVVYTLPLPADGAVIGYAMRLGSRVIRGEVRGRDEAKAAYEKALFEGHAAGLLEQDRDDTFTQRLGSLPARQSAEITIEVLHPLGFLPAGDEVAPQWEYRFPTVVSVRYEGAAGRVPDADRLDIDRAAGPGEIPTRIELALTTQDDAGAAVRRVESMRLDRDLVVRWPAGVAAVGARIVEGPGLPGDDGRYGLLTITPPRVSQTAFARDLTILIDASGSMSGYPIVWAKDVASGLLRSLGTGDRFEVIAFSMRPRSLTGGLIEAREMSIQEALGALAQLSAGGATEMGDAVVEALRPLRPDSQHQVVLITDGQIGFEDEIVRRIVTGLPDGARLHTVAVGAAPNRTLTLRAARAGRGVESFVCGDAEVKDTVRRVVAATARPILTDLRIAAPTARGLAPARPRDVLAGQPLTVALELAPEGGLIEVRGQLAGSSEPWSFPIVVPPIASRENPLSIPLGALYGREAIADLTMSDGRDDARMKEIALRHRIASRVTSLVAVSEEPSVDPNAPRRRVALPVEMPAHLSAEMVGLRSASAYSSVRGVRSGAPEIEMQDEMFFPSTADEDEPAFLRRPVRAGGWLGRLMGRPGAEDKMRSGRRREFSIPARVLAVTGDLVIVEIESPSDDFLRPWGDVELVRDESVIGRGSIDSSQSSPLGRHKKGLLLRLAIRGASSWTCGVGDEITITRGATP